MSNLLKTPELLDKIFGFCDKGDLVVCVLTSRFWFFIAAPLLWGDVTCSSTNILGLIIGTRIDQENLHITLPQKLSNDHFVRFQMYAKFTQTLELQEKTNWTVENSSDLILYAHDTVLLPRLRSLSVRSDYCTESQFNRVPALFWESLFEIRSGPNIANFPFLPLSTAVIWLDVMAAKCPNLQVLSLHPCSEWSEWDKLSESVQDVRFKLFDRACVAIPKMVLLYHLSINMYLSDLEILAALASLPHLEHLEIATALQTDVYIIPPPLASDAFFNLKRLGIYDADVENMRNALSTDYLMRGLTSLDLVIDLHSQGLEYQGLNQWLWDELRQRLIRATCLTIRFKFTYNEPPYETSETALGHLANIPLEHILITKFHVTASTSCQLLASKWPNITHLQWPDQPAQMSDLVYFASLPHLRHLTLDLNICSVHTPNSSLAVSRFESFRTLECSNPDYAEGFEADQVRGIAEWVMIQPNVSLAWPNDATPLCHTRMSLLQDALATLAKGNVI